MSEPSPFDPVPDPVLGRLLREHLDAPDATAFVARVMAGGRFALPETPLHVLARWAPRGLAAALLALVVAGWLAVKANRSQPASSEEGLLPGPEVVLAAVIDGQ